MDDKEMFIKIAKKYGAKENDGQGLRIIMPDGEIKPLTEEIMREVLFPFIPDLNIPFVTGMSTDADKPIPECKTWSDCSTCEHEAERNGSNCYECVKGIENRYSPKEAIEIKYGEKNLIKGDCKHCSDHVDYMTWGEDTLYACRLRKCKFEESE